MVRYEYQALDATIYAQLRQSAAWPCVPRSQAQAGIDGGFFNLVAFDGHTAVGMGRMISDGAIFFHIVDVVVNPAHQGRGIGSQLLKRLIGYARQATPPGCRSCVSLTAAEGKEGFYRRLGFETLYGGHCGSGMRLVIERRQEG